MSRVSIPVSRVRPVTASPVAHRSFWVVFDLGGTLVAEDFPPLAAATDSDVAGLGFTSAEFNHHLLTLLGLLLEAETAPGERQNPAAQIIEGYLATHLPTCSRTTVEEIVWQLIGGDRTNFLTPLPGALELLADLHHKAIRVAALSNSSLPLSFVNRVLEVSGVRPFLTTIVLSSECGWRKPAPEAFTCLAREAGIDAADTVVFIGNDVAKDIVPARACGFLPILVASDFDAAAEFHVVADLVAAGNAVTEIHRVWRVVPPIGVGTNGQDLTGEQQ